MTNYEIDGKPIKSAKITTYKDLCVIILRMEEETYIGKVYIKRSIRQ